MRLPQTMPIASTNSSSGVFALKMSGNASYCRVQAYRECQPNLAKTGYHALFAQLMNSVASVDMAARWLNHAPYAVHNMSAYSETVRVSSNLSGVSDRERACAVLQSTCLICCIQEGSSQAGINPKP